MGFLVILYFHLTAFIINKYPTGLKTKEEEESSEYLSLHTVTRDKAAAFRQNKKNENITLKVRHFSTLPNVLINSTIII